MQERRAILVDLHARFGRAAEVRLAGLAHQAIQDSLRGARGEDGHSNAAAGGAHQGVGHRVVRNEVGVGQIDR